MTNQNKDFEKYQKKFVEAIIKFQKQEDLFKETMLKIQVMNENFKSFQGLFEEYMDGLDHEISNIKKEIKSGK